MPDSRGYLWVLEGIDHLLITPRRCALRMLMQEMAPFIQLFPVQADYKVEVNTTLGKDGSNFLVGPLGEVQRHERAKWRTGRTSYQPVRLLVTDSGSGFSTIGGTREIPVLSRGLNCPEIQRGLSQEIQVAPLCVCQVDDPPGNTPP